MSKIFTIFLQIYYIRSLHQTTNMNQNVNSPSHTSNNVPNNVEMRNFQSNNNYGSQINNTLSHLTPQMRG